MLLKNGRGRTAYALLLGVLVAGVCMGRTPSDNSAQTEKTADEKNPKVATAIVAGGCFWCVETDFENAPGVLDVISGYSGGKLKNPTYKTYSSGGHREVALIKYDTNKITYAGIVEWLIKHVDPTDPRGQFNDRGIQYSPAIYYASDEEKEIAEKVIAMIDDMKVYRGKVQLAVEPRKEFFPAEDYHQDYHHKNSAKYYWFRMQSGRDRFVSTHWGNRASKLELEGSVPDNEESTDQSRSVEKLYAKWLDYKKPSLAELKAKLTPLQFRVTQQDGTEKAHANAYHDNKRAGIYVDLLSGAPLFSSTDKFDSGTGWPSFLKPIVPEAVFYKVDRSNFFLGVRTEVRSSIGDSHLGHVFDDAPPQLGGRRFCMNSAAMRFVPKEDMEKEGYGDFLKFVE